MVELGGDAGEAAPAGRGEPGRPRGPGRLAGPGADRRRARRSSCSPTSPTASRPRLPAPSRSQGVGLFRTELCFLDRRTSPTVEEQAEIYAEVLGAFGEGRHVVVRTLDAGSDKPIAFATHDGEENPALGVRGLRLSFDNPGLMDRQLDGIRLAAERTGTETWVMAPMVATVAEAADFAGRVRGPGSQGRA